MQWGTAVSLWRETNLPSPSLSVHTSMLQARDKGLLSHVTLPCHRHYEDALTGRGLAEGEREKKVNMVEQAHCLGSVFYPPQTMTDGMNECVSHRLGNADASRVSQSTLANTLTLRPCSLYGSFTAFLLLHIGLDVLLCTCLQ